MTFCLLYMDFRWWHLRDNSLDHWRLTHYLFGFLAHSASFHLPVLGFLFLIGHVLELTCLASPLSLLGLNSPSNLGPMTGDYSPFLLLRGLHGGRLSLGFDDTSRCTCSLPTIRELGKGLSSSWESFLIVHCLNYNYNINKIEMKKGETRFFINWQISKEEAQSLHQANSDKERTQLLEKWIARSSGLVSAAAVDDESHWNVIINYFEGHFDLARKAKFD